MSPQSGDVLVLTTRGSRGLAWVAAIPHWLYFTHLRVNDRVWNRVIIWTSGVGCFLAVLGIVRGSFNSGGHLLRPQQPCLPAFRIPG